MEDRLVRSVVALFLIIVAVFLLIGILGDDAFLVAGIFLLFLGLLGVGAYKRAS